MKKRVNIISSNQFRISGLLQTWITLDVLGFRVRSHTDAEKDSYNKIIFPASQPLNPPPVPQLRLSSLHLNYKKKHIEGAESCRLQREAVRWWSREETPPVEATWTWTWTVSLCRRLCFLTELFSSQMEAVCSRGSSVCVWVFFLFFLW